MTSTTSAADDTEVADEDESLDALPSASPVTYFGTEFDVHGLVRRYSEKSILVPSFDPTFDLPDPNAQGFQRGRVWTKPQMDRFVESLLLGFPVPGIFLVEQPGKKYLVLDGQQRLTTLAAFYEGVISTRVFALENVDKALKGVKYSSLSEDTRRSLDDTFIQAIIIRAPQDAAEYESVYQIFERLNSGGTQLQPHEIRVALYGGVTVETIRELNNDANWRLIYGKRSERLKDQELILRVLALWQSASIYAAPLKSFLNTFLATHRSGTDIDLGRASELFKHASQTVAEAVGATAFRLGTQVNAAILDSVFVALMRREVKALPPLSSAEFSKRYKTLLGNAEFLDAVTKATANEESVKTRLAKATQAFERK